MNDLDYVYTIDDNLLLLCSFRHNMMVTASPNIKPVFWIGSAKKDLCAFPEEVKDSIGFALYVAQQGGKHASVKPLKGFGGAGVLEVVEDHDGDTYRAV
jgi:phage-related protein